MQRVVPYRKAKTRRSRVALEKRAPLLVENPKSILYVHGSKCSQVVQNAFKDLENMSAQQDASLLAFGSHNKKRPHNIIFARMFDHHILDMAELGIQQIKLMSEFKNEKNMLGSKPCIVFLGHMFTTNPEYARLKNLLGDFFRGPVVPNINLAGLDHAIVFIATEEGIAMRHYRIALKKSGSRLPLAELDEIGPSIDFTLRRTKWATDDLLKLALKKPKELKQTKVKNISHVGVGDRVGRLHMEKQDLGKLQTRKVKALKRKPEPKAKSTEPNKRSRRPVESSGDGGDGIEDMEQ